MLCLIKSMVEYGFLNKIKDLKLTINFVKSILIHFVENIFKKQKE